MRSIRSLLPNFGLPFQILSDLHLEINQQYSSFDTPVSAPYLVLAGDVGRLIDYDAYLIFLKRQTDLFHRVFLVLGNHEFYGASFAAGVEKAERLEKEPSLNGRLVLLHRTRYDVPNSQVSVLGCTLRSQVPAGKVDVVTSKIKDFEKIQDWTVDDHNTSHKADSSWLRQQIDSLRLDNDNAHRKRVVLVVTHHAPSTSNTSSPAHARNPWTVAFATDLLSRGDWPGVKAWVFGHTHYTTEFRDRHVRVISNQRGYVLPWSSSESPEKNKFNVKKVILI